MKISMGSWAFSFGPYSDRPVPFEDTVRRLSEAGYDGIEICGFPPHVTVEKYPDSESRKELVNFLRANKLGASGYSADLSSVNPLSPGNKERYLELFENCVEMCVDIGSPSIRVDSTAAPGSIPDSEYQDAFNRLAAVWRDSAAIALKYGIKVVWEFEPGFAFNKPSEIVALHQRVNHENFKIMFDTSHAYMCGVTGARQHGKKEVLGGGVAEFLQLLKGRIGAIHLIDSDGTLQGDETSTHRPFGEGLIDFQALAPQLLLVPNIDWWCIDLCFWPGSWNLVESSLTFVKDLLNQKAAVR
jgi:sugar phosphate isomerase/epimerase